MSVDVKSRHLRPVTDLTPAEEHVLGALLIDPTAWAKVEGLLQADDFGRPDHRLIFGAIRALAESHTPHDIVTVDEYLRRHAQSDEAGGQAYVLKLARETATAENVAAYAEIVRSAALRRNLTEIGENLLRVDVAPASLLNDALTHLQVLMPEQSRRAPLIIAPASSTAGAPMPPPRDYVCEELNMPAGCVIALNANGGEGKSTIAVQIGIHTSVSRALWGMPIHGGPVLGIFCEDSQAEIDRKIRIVCEEDNISHESLDQLYLLSRDGCDNGLCVFDGEHIVLTPFYQQLEATVADIRPRLLIVDPLADVFLGNHLSTPHTRQFLKVALGGLCAKYGTTVLLLAHPSAAGMASGDGAGFSTAWNNSVRSRLYLRRPKSDDPEAIADRRVLEVRKANYGRTGGCICIVYERGRFVLDPDPIDEGAKISRAPKHDTRLALAVMDYFRDEAPNSQVVAFRPLFETLQRNAHLPQGAYENVRKTLQRTLKALVSEGCLRLCDVPRGYRIVRNAGEPSL